MRPLVGCLDFLAEIVYYRGTKSSNMKKIALIALGTLFLTSCSKEKALESRLDNQTWNIAKYEFQLSNNGVVDPGQSVSVENVGTVDLKKDGTGSFKVSAGGNSESYTIDSWSIPEEAKVDMNVTDDATKGKATWNFTVTTNERKKQVWTREVKQGNFLFTFTYTLTR